MTAPLPLRAERIANPSRFLTRIRAAMRDASGRVPEAAAALGVSERQLYRYLVSEPKLASVRRAPMGRPRKEKEP